MVARMGSLGTTELLIILGVILLVFGGTKLPKLARSLGQAQGEFKKGIEDGNKEAEKASDKSSDSSDSKSA